MSASHTIIIKAAHGRPFELNAGDTATITLMEGPQVVDCWAFAGDALEEHLSCEHTRSCLEKLIPAVGDALYSSRRQPLLAIVEDTSPGVHDLLLSACDHERYALLGHEGPHRNCADNLREALAALDLVPPEIPSPVNLFENVAIGAGGTLEITPPVAKQGDAITLRAERDLVLALSACPMDIAATNGADRTVKPVQVEIVTGG